MDTPCDAYVSGKCSLQSPRVVKLLEDTDNVSAGMHNVSPSFKCASEFMCEFINEPRSTWAVVKRGRNGAKYSSASGIDRESAIHI